MACIYEIRNLVNDKFYIGSTYRPFYKRRFEHLYKLKNNIHYNKRLQNSFNKYGEKNFKVSIIEKFKKEEFKDFEELITALRDKEYLYIQELLPFYNIKTDSTKGRTGYTHSPETRAKISASLLNKREFRELSEATIKKIDREKRRKEGRLYENRLNKKIKIKKGRARSQEVKDKLREFGLREENRERMRKLQQVAAKNRIGQHCSEDRKIKSATTKFGVNRCIDIYDLNNNLLHTCNFSPQASEYTGVLRSAISNNLVGLSKTAGGYIFKYRKIE